MLFSRDYVEFDPAKKDKFWAQRMVTQFRMSSYIPLYDRNKAKENRDIIDSNNSMEKLKKMFDDPEKMIEKGFDFIGISIMEKIKNILISEKWKAELSAYVDSQDPSLMRLKKEDKNLLKSKAIIDKKTNELKAKIGLPPSNIGNDDFNGNYSDFEAMGFDELDEMDIEQFFQTFYQLDTEIELQKIINHVFYINSISDQTYDFTMDGLATKTMAIQQYVNKINGAITIKRLQPENVWRIKGEGKTNQKNDVAVGYYERITIAEFLRRAGDNFDFVNDFTELLNGVSNVIMSSSSQFTGIDMEDGSIIGSNSGNLVRYSDLVNYTVDIGYIEHKSIDAVDYKVFKNRFGNTKAYRLDKNRDNETKEYQKVSDFKERTYFAWFLVTSSLTQYVYNWGKLYHQETEGQEDEISSYSIKYIQYQGNTIAEVAKPWITVAQEAFVKFRYLLRKAKEDGRQWNLESLMEVAKQFYGEDGGAASLLSVMEMFNSSVNEIYAMPKDSQGNPILTQGGVNFDKPNQFDTKFKSYMDIVDWAVQKIKDDIGINNLREGGNPETNDVYKLEKASLETSNNATMYLDNMFDYIYRNSSLSILATAQDVIKFKDSLPYKYLLNVIGEEGVKRLESIPNISFHRQEIYITSFANYTDRIQVLNDTAIAFQKGVIDYATKVLIDKTNDPRKAQKLLMIKEQKALKLKKQEAEQASQREIELDNTKTQNKILVIREQGKIELMKSQVMAEGYIRAAQINADQRGNIQDKKTDGEKEKEILKHQLVQQEAFIGS